MTDPDITDRLEGRASDGSRLVFTRDERGVSLSVGQCPDRSVSVRLPGAEWERIRTWLSGASGGTTTEQEELGLAAPSSSETPNSQDENRRQQDTSAAVLLAQVDAIRKLRVESWEQDNRDYIAGQVERIALAESVPAVPAGPGDTVPRAPVQALLDALAGGQRHVVDHFAAEVRRHLDATTTPARGGPAMSDIEIVQDREASEDGEIGGDLQTFWADGHGYEPERFTRAVIDYTLEMHGEVPRLDAEDAPAEAWQWNRTVQDGVIYERAQQPPEGARRGQWQPITVLDLERRGRGATKCGIRGCDKPWSVGTPVQVVIEPRNADGSTGAPYMAVDVWLCREHSKRFPEPSYRVCMVPVGAEIVLDPVETQR